MNRRLSKVDDEETKMSNRVNYLESIQSRILKKIKETRVKSKKVLEIKGMNEQSFLDRIGR